VQRSRQRGFTLIEMLTVVAIISVLAAILFPVFGSARERGRQTQCLSNLRQLGLALNMYAHDYDERYPLAGAVGSAGADWVPAMELPNDAFRVESGALFSYAKSAELYRCKSDPEGFRTGLSYRMNGELGGFPMGAVECPSSVVLLIEAPVKDACFRIGNAPDDTPIPVYDPATYPADRIPSPMNPTHLDKASIVFVDGHVDAMRFGQVKASMFYTLPER